MIVHVYKNYNVTVKMEPGYDSMPETLEELVCALYNENELNGYSVGEFECWGNSYGAYPLQLITRGSRCLYYVTPDDLEAYQAGKTVRLVFSEFAPLFTLPTFYSFQPFTLEDGTRGTLYKLSEEPADDQKEEMLLAGCEFFRTYPQYAPEMIRHAVFVPRGVPFYFC